MFLRDHTFNNKAKKFFLKAQESLLKTREFLLKCDRGHFVALLQEVLIDQEVDDVLFVWHHCFSVFAFFESSLCGAVL